MDNNTIQLSRDVDLVFSPDDVERYGKGYYLHRYKPTNGISKMFATADEATAAFKAGKVRWDA